MSKGIFFKRGTPATAIVQTGMAFGIDPVQQHLGDVLVSSSLIPYDRRKALAHDGHYRFDYVDAEFQPARPSMLELFLREAQKNEWPFRIHVGAVLSGGTAIYCTKFRDELVTGQVRWRRLRAARLPKVVEERHQDTARGNREGQVSIEGGRERLCRVDRAAEAEEPRRPLTNPVTSSGEAGTCSPTSAFRTLTWPSPRPNSSDASGTSSPSGSSRRRRPPSCSGSTSRRCLRSSVGRVAGYTIDRLFRLLTALGQRVEITVRPNAKNPQERAVVVT